MKDRPSSAFLPGLALACGMIAITAPAWGKRPPKDPPPASGVAYTMVAAGDLGEGGSGAYAINDSGAVVGVLKGIWPAWHAFLLEPQNGDYFRDDNFDGINDLAYLVAGPASLYDCGFVTVGLLDGLTVVLDRAASFQGVCIVPPDSSDADGDGNPWYTDTDGDGFNDLQVFIAAEGEAESQSIPTTGVIAGSLGGGQGAALFDAVTMDTTLLGGAPRRGSSVAVAVNGAGWTIGRAYDHKATPSALFWKDGVLSKFTDIATGPVTDPWPIAINQAGVICGSS